MKTKVYISNAFVKNGKGGNPAGIVINADNLNEQDMQYIAKRVGLSETAFIQTSNKASFKTRFFTPNAEVDLCGHATIASFSFLFQQKLIPAGKHSQESKAGILGLEILPDGTVFMSQTTPEFSEVLPHETTASILNIRTENLMPDIPVQVVSTGLRDIIIPVENLKTLFSIKPDMKKLSRLSEQYKVIGCHAFTLETKYNATAHCRNFAPLYGIDEEAATGTSNGALSCYLFHYKKLSEISLENLVFEQGYSMNEPSEIRAKLKTVNNEIKEICVGGKAVLIKEITVD